VFLRQNQDRKVGDDKTDVLQHGASPTAAEKDILVTLPCQHEEIIAFLLRLFSKYITQNVSS